MCDILEHFRDLYKGELLMLICEYLDQFDNLRMSKLLKMPILSSINSDFSNVLIGNFRIKEINQKHNDFIKENRIIYYNECVFDIYNERFIQPEKKFNDSITPIKVFGRFTGNCLIINGENRGDIFQTKTKKPFENIEEIFITDMHMLRVIPENVYFPNLYSIKLRFEKLISYSDFDFFGFSKVFRNVQEVTIFPTKIIIPDFQPKTYIPLKVKKRKHGDEGKIMPVSLFPESVKSLTIKLYDFKQIMYEGKTILPKKLEELFLITRLDFTSIEKILPNYIKKMVIIYYGGNLDLENQIPDDLEYLELIIAVECIKVNLGSLPPKLKHLKLVISNEFNISIISSKLHTIEISFMYKNGKYRLAKHWFLDPALETFYNKQYSINACKNIVSQIKKISKELNPDFTRLILPEFTIQIPDFITELCFERFNGKPEELITLPIFDLSKNLENTIVFIKKTTAINRNLINRFRLPIYVVDVLM